MTKFIERFYSVHSDRSNERLVCLNEIITISKVKLTRKLDNISFNFVHESRNKKNMLRTEY